MTLPTQNHTPTPWEVGPNGWFQAVNSETIIGRVSDGHKNWKENAAFIVRAVNAHEELLEAAKACVEMFDGLQPSDMAPLVNRSAYNRCLRAIAAASERSEKAEGRP